MLLFVLFTLVYRSILVVLLDFSDPVLSIQTGSFVGGGSAYIVFLGAVAVFLFAAFRATHFVFSLSYTSRKRHYRYPVLIRRVALAAVVGLIAGLYLELLYGGAIPLIEGIDRLEYAKTAGPIYQVADDYRFLISFSLGAIVAIDWLFKKVVKILPVGAFAAFMLFWALSGHRFSAFFVCVSFFAAPLSVLYYRPKDVDLDVPLFRVSGRFTKVVTSAAFRYIAVLVLIVVVGFLVFNSYYNVRRYSHVERSLAQRVLVQPVETFWLSWKRVFIEGHWDHEGATTAIFSNPLDDTKNTGIQYLMSVDLGVRRTWELLGHGTQYAGGYPEVAFEWLGPIVGWPFIMFYAMMYGAVAGSIQAFVVRGYLLTSISVITIYYAMSLFYIGGMLNFVIPVTFWMKLFIVVICYTYENNRNRRRY